MSKFTVLILALMALASSSSAFAPSSMTLHRASFVTGATRPSSKKNYQHLQMSENNNEEQQQSPQVSADGTFYDDELDSTPVSKQGISDSMAERLRREASTGLDPDQKQSNVLLYIMAVVGALVILGGQGIFY